MEIGNSWYALPFISRARLTYVRMKNQAFNLIIIAIISVLMIKLLENHSAEVQAFLIYETLFNLKVHGRQ